MWDDIINTSYVFIILLVPLIPAYFIYKILPSEPSTAEVSGPFAGLKIKLTGALAGYAFMALLALFSIKTVCTSDDRKHIKELNEKIIALENQNQLFEIEGHVNLQNNPSQLIDPTKFKITVIPPIVDLRDSGRFFIKWDPRPTLKVQSDNYLPECLELEPEPTDNPRYKMAFDKNLKKITINTPITLQPMPNYTGRGEPPPKVGAAGGEPGL